MRNRSNRRNSVSTGTIPGGEYAPIRLPDDFPVSKPHHVVRTVSNAIRAHIHECFELGVCHEGNSIFLVGDKMLHCGPGDAVAIREGELHLLISPQESSTRWSFVNLDCVRLLAGGLRDLSDADSSPFAAACFPNVISCSERPEICQLAKDIIVELDSKAEGSRHAVMALVWALLVKLRRLSWREPSGHEPGTPSPMRSFDDMDRLRPAIRQIADNFAKDLSVAELSKLCRMSCANFRRLFNRCFGCSPRDYILRLRVEVAKSLLRNSSMPVIELSLKSGFPSLSNFNRQFRRFAGMPPREFRRLKGALSGIA